MNKKEIQELIRKAQSGDEEAKLILVQNHMDLVWSVVHKFGHLEVEKDDLFQIGCMGLLKAIIQFDISYDTTLSTYAIPLIIGEIKAFIREQSPIKISRSIKSNIHKIQEVKDQLNKTLEREPTMKELAEATELTEEQIILALNAPTNVSSLDNYEREDMPLIERIPNHREGMQLEQKIVLKQLVSDLDSTERMLIYLRFDLGYTQSEVAKRLEINQVAVSRLEKKILKELKEKMTS
ncbi:MAG: sigma-70 family RNA polymerase sigma factor [Turicibacter sp.]|uniref:RNA polymerase sigma-F factor n=1 Tax=Turicibacter faecis TaxID=2963365 RepID=A0ABM8IKC9_9FIRM|nr:MULTISPECIES: sigma-70 family RNA polymerase sigma factor [unclassified Turicibacter]MCI8701435.1 sigma-70 family RNA polymerase sigma factor [Turicibacter sp.]BEH91351.1 RNA polymerase sigma-F factor [Turicibacter sp. TC023]MCI9350819.1 sigma-70 family RNA polymerase sigma factor [Turicibacter sp.]MCU7203742.1 sigma-70 family RNA polymerase sigma factor [Turicibacter sp. TA25]MCU7208624.1 sigma-70 family RNA polymerase sigma factor [Turicibacter sp. 1E2]